MSLFILIFLFVFGLLSFYFILFSCLLDSKKNNKNERYDNSDYDDWNY